MRAALAAGLAVDDIAPRLSFFFVARTTLLEEVAKFRAARRIWAQVMRDEFGAQDPRSLMLRFHTQTAGVQLTAQQPEVNMVRVTVQALAAVLGGTQSLHTNSYDEAIALPTEKAARLALRTQQVIAYESDLTATVDPFAGSYAVEAMTDEIEAAIRGLMETVEDLGGAVAAIEAGYQKREIEKSAYDVVRSVEDGSRTVVGVNRFAREADEIYEPLRVDPTIEAQQADRLARLRADRDDADVDRHLAALRAAAAGHRQRPLPDARRPAGPGHRRRGLQRAARGLGHPPPRRRVLRRTGKGRGCLGSCSRPGSGPAAGRCRLPRCEVDRLPVVAAFHDAKWTGCRCPRRRDNRSASEAGVPRPALSPASGPAGGAQETTAAGPLRPRLQRETCPTLRTTRRPQRPTRSRRSDRRVLAAATVAF